jgi:Tfp pilus assembly protein PilV
MQRLNLLKVQVVVLRKTVTASQRVEMLNVNRQALKQGRSVRIITRDTAHSTAKITQGFAIYDLTAPIVSTAISRQVNWLQTSH